MRLVFASIEHDEIFNVHITHNIINRRKYSFNFSLRVTFSAIFLAIIFPNIFFLFFFSLSLVLIFYNNFRFEETDRESVVVVHFSPWKSWKKIAKYPNYFQDIIVFDRSMLQFFKHAKIGWKGIWFIEVERERESERCGSIDLAALKCPDLDPVAIKMEDKPGLWFSPRAVSCFTRFPCREPSLLNA